MLVASEVLTANKIGGVEGGDESIEKCRKLSKIGKSSKSGNSKGKKSAKSKKTSKSRNSPNFNATKDAASFLTSKARAAFNCLQITFNKAPILQHFDLEYHIRIKTDESGYAMGVVLS